MVLFNLQCVIIIDNYTLYAVPFHESVHEQKKSHKRTLCDRSFSLKTNLKRQFKKKIYHASNWSTGA